MDAASTTELHGGGGGGAGHEAGVLAASGTSPRRETAPPELCVVNMFWNDLPGLVMDGREYVRLVDIHRQVRARVTAQTDDAR